MRSAVSRSASASGRADSRSHRATSAGTRHAIASVWISVSPSSSLSCLASVSMSRISSSEVVPCDQ